MTYNWIEGKFSDICGNYIIKVSDKPVLESDLSDSALSDAKYKGYRLKPTNTFQEDIKRIFKDAEPDIFYSEGQPLNDRLIRTTLFLFEGLPSRFIIMKKNGSNDEADHTIHKEFSFEEGTVIGDYLANTISDERFNFNPVGVDFEEKALTINGVDVMAGTLVNKLYGYDQISNELVSSIFKAEFCVPASILHLGYMKDWDEEDDDDYYWFYSQDIKFGDFYADNVSGNFVYNSSQKRISGIQNVNEYTGVLASDPDWFYVKNKGEYSQASNIDQWKIDIYGEIPSFFNVKEDAEIEVVTDEKVIAFDIKTRFGQSDTIKISFLEDNGIFIADELFNVPNFGLTDHIANIFNPAGTVEQQAESLAGSIEEFFRGKVLIDVYSEGSVVIMRYVDGLLPSTFLEIEASANNVELLDRSYPFNIKDGFLAKSDSLEKGEFIRSKNGYHEILGDFVDEVDLGAKWLAFKQYFGEKDLTRIWQRDRIEYGVIEPILEGALVDQVITNKTVVSDYIGKFLNQETLTVGVEYLVNEGEILHNGIVYSEGDTFTAADTEYEKIVTDCEVLINIFFIDQEVQKFLNSFLSDIINPEIEEVDRSWVSIDVRDAKLEKYSVQYSQLSNFEEHNYDPLLNTHNTFLLSSNFSETFDTQRYLDEKEDIFLAFFKNQSTKIISRLDGKSETIFNGVKFVLDEDLDGYEFACFLDIKLLDDANTDNIDPLQLNIYKNETFENVLFKIDLYVKDYKALDYMDYAYIAMMAGIKNTDGTFGQEFNFPSITGLNFNTSTYRGIKINKLQTADGNPPTNGFNFIGDIFRLDTWVRRFEEEFGGIIGFSRDRDSFIMTFDNPNAGSNDVVIGDPFDIDVLGNTLTVSDGLMYVGAINGTLFDSLLPVSTIKTIETFDDYEWYQITTATRPYERIKKLLSAAGISDILSREPEELNKDVDIKVQKPEAEAYSNEFTLDLSRNQTYKGSVVSENWTLYSRSWDISDNIIWQNPPASFDLDLILGAEINIIKQ